MMRHENFAALILTHGRPDRVVTLRTLEQGGYTGRSILVVDDEDETYSQYVDIFGQENVVKFNKEYYFQNFDTMDAGGSRGVIFAARNAAFDIAKEQGLTYFAEFDDDYRSFDMRYADGFILRHSAIRDLDSVFDAMLDFLDDSKAKAVAFVQGGDLMRGCKDHSMFEQGLVRKCMNTIFCRTDNRVNFLGRISEDVNTYITAANRGELMFSYTRIQITQHETQSNAGGMTETYKAFGTYLKSFYSVMCSPQSVHVGGMGTVYKRMHHRIDWNKTAPKILSQRYHKSTTNGLQTD